MSGAAEFVGRLNQFLIEPLLTLLATAALVLFIWGGAMFIFNAGSEEARTKGKKQMIWGLIGLFVIVAGLAVVEIILNTFNVGVPSQGVPSFFR